MGYELKLMDGDLVGPTRQEWERQIAESTGDILVAHYLRILDWSEKHADGETDDHCYVYGLVGDDASYACAILDLAHARPESNNPWLKMLAMYLEPNFDLENCGEYGDAEIEALSNLLSSALTETLQLTFSEHPSTKLKVYARNDLHLGFFESLASRSKEIVPGLTLSTHGRWLQFEKDVAKL